MSLFSELKRRNVFRVAAAYLVGAWLLVEVSSTLEETLRLPEWADSLLAMFLLLGFPVALFLSWAYEVTPDGIRRESEVTRNDASRAITARRLDWAVIAMVVLAGGLYFADRMLPSRGVTAPVASTAADPQQADPVADDPAPANAGAAQIEPLSIAVLPFINMSSDPEQEYFSDGLTEELLNLLAGIDELKVAARTSSFFYKDKLEEVPLLEIARQLEVAHVLEGSVRKGGDRIRITAQLIKADDGFHLWSATWDRTLNDVFAIQDEIAAAVVDELRVTLLGELPRARVIDPRSLELSMRGRFLYNRRDPGDVEQALALFEEAIAIDPDNAAAWLGAAPLYIYLNDPPDHEKAQRAARRAIELEPENAAARMRLAQALMTSGDEESARRETERGWQLGQQDPLVLSIVAGLFMYNGDMDRCIELTRRAIAIDPLNLINLGNFSTYLMDAGRLDDAATIIAKMQELAPESAATLERLATLSLLQGRFEDALEITQRLPEAPRTLRMDPEPKFSLLAMAHHSLGNREGSDAALAAYRERAGDAGGLELARIHAWRGDTDEALDVMEREVEERPEWISLAELDSHWFDSLGNEPRWQAIEQKLQSRPSDFRPEVFADAPDAQG